MAKPKQVRKQPDNLFIKSIRPLNYAQKQFFEAWEDDYNIIASGYAGTGKTYLASFLALRSLFNSEQREIIFVRSTVSTRDVGFLPGSIDEKIAPYFEIYKDHVTDICASGTAWDSLLHRGAVRTESTSYVRGSTWNNAIVIIDESQNLTRHEVYSVLTRLGHNSRVMVLGDARQTDLPKGSSSAYLQQLANKMPDDFELVTFTAQDIVRSDFCRALIIADSEIL
jgi:phosphate starvation-inducible PhoH-like protein